MDLTAVLTSASPRVALDDLLLTEGRFAFLEALRVAALGEMERHAQAWGEASSLRLRLADAELQLVQRQFQVLDAAVVGTLTKDGAEQLYATYRPPIDLDLPDDPDSLRDPRVAYVYALQRLYRRQFDVSLLHEKKNGCWPLIWYDLLDRLDGKRSLLIEAVPEAVKDHSSADFVNQMDAAQTSRVKTIFTEVVRNASARIDANDQIIMAGRIKIIIKILKGIKEVGEGVLVAVGLREAVILQQERERKATEEAERRRAAEAAAAAEREARDRWNREIRERSIPNGSGHMELYERNKEYIGGLC